jgi:hypothetical protein
LKVIEHIKCLSENQLELRRKMLSSFGDLCIRL